MKTFLAIVFIALLGLLVEASVIKKITPKDIVVPLNPKYTYAEWQDIMASQKQIPQPYPGFKRGSKPQPVFAGKVYAPDSRITHGNTAERGQFPWQVAIMIDDSWLCGGSILTEEWILTAAHCAYFGSSYEVTLGANRIDIIEDGVQTVTTRTAIIHEHWDLSLINNDIALMKVSNVQYTQYISPVKLPSPNVGDLVGETVRVSGWGRFAYNNANYSSTLQYVDLTVITNTECVTSFGSLITPTKLCTSTTGSKSPCGGDSGGPLALREEDGGYVEVGIVSFGNQNGCELETPVAYTRVSSYLDWIETNTGIQT